MSDAVGRSAKISCGGKVAEGKGLFYPPTVMANVPADSELVREEIFGQVAPLYRF